MKSIDRYERRTYSSTRDRGWAQHARHDMREAREIAARFNSTHTYR